MGQIANKSVTGFFVSGGQTITSSRTKLYGVQYIMPTGYHFSSVGVPNIGTATIDTSTIELRDGSASGAITFKFTAPLSRNEYYNGINPINFMLGNNYVLFESGIHASSVGEDEEDDDAVDGNTVTISFFYEVG